MATNFRIKQAVDELGSDIWCEPFNICKILAEWRADIGLNDGSPAHKIVSSEKDAMKVFLAAAAAALTASLSTPSAAEIRILYQESGWRVLGGLNADGIAVCNLTYNMDRVKFSFVLLKGSPVLHLQVFNAFQESEGRMRVSVEVKLDSEPEWRTNFGIVFVDKGDTVLDFFVDSSGLDNWLNKFKRSRTLNIELKDDSLRNWHVELTDPEPTGVAMKECVAWAHNAPEPPPYRP